MSSNYVPTKSIEDRAIDVIGYVHKIVSNLGSDSHSLFPTHSNYVLETIMSKPDLLKYDMEKDTRLVSDMVLSSHKKMYEGLQ